MADVTTTVIVPVELGDLPDCSALYGYAHPDTRRVLVVG